MYAAGTGLPRQAFETKKQKAGRPLRLKPIEHPDICPHSIL